MERVFQVNPGPRVELESKRDFSLARGFNQSRERRLNQLNSILALTFIHPNPAFKHNSETEIPANPRTGIELSSEMNIKANPEARKQK